MKRKSSVVFKLSVKFASILTAAVLLIIFAFVSLLQTSRKQTEAKELKRTAVQISRALKTGNDFQLEKRLSELPFFISWIIYDTETKEILRQKNDRLGILPVTDSKPVHYAAKKLSDLRTSIIYVTRDCTTPSGQNVTIQIAQNTNNDPGRRFIYKMLLLIGSAAIPILVISYLLSLYITKKTIEPVVKITSAAKQISSKNLEQRLPQTGTNDELDILAQTFNDIFEKLKTDFEQERSFTGNVSHELKTPVAVILGQANLLRRWGKDNPAQLEKSLNIILQETHSMESIISNLLQLSRLESGKITPQIQSININNLFERLKTEFSSINPDCTVNYNTEADSSVESDEELLHQVFAALISNSNKFVQSSPVIELKCIQNKSETIFFVEDNGPGFAESVLPHVFERFYKGDESHNRKAGGCGLGLSIAKAVITSLRGTIEASNGHNGGALITITLPCKPVEKI